MRLHAKPWQGERTKKREAARRGFMHNDGGALAMEVYNHPGDTHSAEIALKVSWRKPTGTGLIPVQRSPRAGKTANRLPV